MGVIVFTKYPHPGQVKTRMAPEIGLEHAAGLQTAFVRDEVEMLRSINVDITLCCDPRTPLSKYRHLYGPDLAYSFQSGHDLGARMLHALHAVHDSHADPVLLIGSDLPDLPSSRIDQAFLALREVAACIGPSPDGGFYLVGISHALPEDIFADVVWGSGSVLEQTLDNFRRASHFLTLIEPWPDVDTYADLLRYTERNQHRDTHAMSYIRAHGLAEAVWKK